MTYAPHTCLQCSSTISKNVFEYSIQHFGVPLCVRHQRWLEAMERATTPETISLYFALKMRAVPAELEKYDGHKHIDIAIPDAKVNIEVDGTHHNTNPDQALADLKRTFYSFKKGFLTLRIPNSLVRNQLDVTADYLVDFMMENKYRNREDKRWYYKVNT